MEICGIHTDLWIGLVLGSYTFGESSVSFNGYPDGLPLLEQEEVAINVFNIVFSEIMKVRNNAS